MSSLPTAEDAAHEDPGAVASKKLQRRLAKAQYRAQQKVKRAAAVANGEDISGTHRQRKRRSQRDCNRHGALKRLAAADASERDDGDTPEISYVACTSSTCGSGGSCRLRVVAPYIHRFETFVKARWCGRRLGDVFLHEFAGLPADYCQAAISMGLIRINGQPQELEYILRNGDFLEHIMHRHEPPVHCSIALPSSPSPSPAPTFVHHDEDEVVVVNKPSSIPVHPSGAYLHNSVTLLLQRECSLSELFPVHRLDRLTSGLLMLAKSAAKAKTLCEEIASGQVQKHYVARVLGEFPVARSAEGGDTDAKARGTFDHVQRETDSGLAQISKMQLKGTEYWSVSAPIGCVDSAEHLQGVVVNESSKSAQTLMRRLSFDGIHSVVECLPITGRTHQIRVQLKFLGFPIVNDPQYGPDKTNPISDDSEAANGTHETEPVQSKSAREHFDDHRASTRHDDKSDDATKCESICAACKDGEGTIFSAIQQHCFTLWLHSYKYESAKWAFEVPFPSWASLE